MDDGTIGAHLRRARRDRALTQEQLAERAGVSVAVVQKLEQGRRGSARTTTLIALAEALDIDLSELTGKRPRLDRNEDVRVLGLRDAVLSPDLLPDVDVDQSGEPPSIDHLRVEVASAWRDYWAGRFTHLAAVLPELVSHARAAQHAGTLEVAPLLGQVYQLVAYLLIHLGKDDLAAMGAERAIQAATAGNDELQWATFHGAYSWALLHQGRTDAAERHAVWAAERIEPSMTGATLPQLTVWGGLMVWAMAAAVAGGRKAEAVEYIGLARSAAGRFDGERHDYQVNFGPTQVAVQATHAFAVLREPGRALQAATGVRRGDIGGISWGRHLIDVAQAQVDARDLRGAERTLVAAEGMSSEWFRHQGPARSLVGDLVHESRRLSPPLRHLARAAGVDD